MTNKTKYFYSRYPFPDTAYKVNLSLQSISWFRCHRNTYRSTPLNSFVVSLLTHVHCLSVTRTLFILFRLHLSETLSYRTSDDIKVSWKNSIWWLRTSITEVLFDELSVTLPSAQRYFDEISTSNFF